MLPSFLCIFDIHFPVEVFYKGVKNMPIKGRHSNEHIFCATLSPLQTLWDPAG